MQAPDRPDNEQDRLRQLYRMDILDTPPEAVFDDFTRLAAILCKTLFSTVSLIDHERQWFKSVTGPLGVTETSRDVSFCGHAIMGDDLLIIEDAQADDRFRDNPVVTAGPMIRFYAGAPLITREGTALGTLCVFDPNPGSISEAQKEGLRLLAKQVTERIEQRLTNTLIEHLGTLLDVSKSYVIMFDPFSEQVSFLNPELARRLGDQVSYHSRDLVNVLFPELDYDRFLSADRLTQDQGERRKVTRVAFPDVPDGQAELRILPHLKQGRHTCVLLFSDQTELSRTQLLAEQAQSNVRVFNKVATQSKNAVIITDEHERIEWVNDSFEKLTGYTAAEVMGKVPGDFLQGPDTSNKDRERIRKHIDEGNPVVQEILNYGKNGESYWVEIYIEPIRDDNGRITHFVASQNNITHRKEQDQAIRASRAAAEKANRAKSQFLANISHELRTPLNGIMGVTERLYEQVPDNLRDSVATLDQSSRHLLSLLNELIDLSHIESGHLTLNPEPFVLQALLQDVERLFQPRAEAVGTRLAVHYDGNPEDTFMGDATRLRQVLINLVNNAVKFTPNGDITLGVHKAQQTDSTVELQFSVSDTGPGIPQADQHRIFESFEQLDNSPTRVHGGSGLGLAICRQIIRAMGSDFTLVSEPGQGSTFAFSIQLPALLSEGNDEPLTNARSVSHALVIDDNEVNRKVLENLLQRLGIRVVYTAGSARRGLALLENLQPDLVFVDLHMPGMDGMDFLATARTEFAERGRAMPFTVACTADVGDQQKRACLAAGFDAHLGKPVSVAAVKKLVRSLGLSLPDSPDRIESDGAAQPEFVTRSVLDIDALKRSFLGNEDLLQEFLGLLKENLPTHIERIDEALGLGNITAHYDAAHSIKGLVGYFEDPQLMTLVTDLETAMKRGDIDTAKARFAPVRQLLDTLLKDIRALLKKLS